MAPGGPPPATGRLVEGLRCAVRPEPDLHPLPAERLLVVAPVAGPPRPRPAGPVRPSGEPVPRGGRGARVDPPLLERHPQRRAGRAQREGPPGALAGGPRALCHRSPADLRRRLLRYRHGRVGPRAGDRAPRRGHRERLAVGGRPVRAPHRLPQLRGSGRRRLQLRPDEGRPRPPAGVGDAGAIRALRGTAQLDAGRPGRGRDRLDGAPGDEGGAAPHGPGARGGPPRGGHAPGAGPRGGRPASRGRAPLRGDRGHVRRARGRRRGAQGGGPPRGAPLDEGRAQGGGALGSLRAGDTPAPPGGLPGAPRLRSPPARARVPVRGPARGARPPRRGALLRRCRRPAAPRDPRHPDRLLHGAGAPGPGRPRAGPERSRRRDGGGSGAAGALVQPRLRPGPARGEASPRSTRSSGRSAPGTRTVRTLRPTRTSPHCAERRGSRRSFAPRRPNG